MLAPKAQCIKIGFNLPNLVFIKKKRNLSTVIASDIIPVVDSEGAGALSSSPAGSPAGERMLRSTQYC